MEAITITKTGYNREAVKEKVEQKRKEESLKLLKKFFGAAKIKVSDARLREIREKVGRETAEEFGIDLD